ncbi:MAG: PspC domain-containing protein [Paludibacteraceae bacterium]
MENKKLVRPLNDVKIAGVCAGIANFIGIDPTLVRVIYAVFCFITIGTGILIYLLLMLIIPKEEVSTASTTPSETKKTE